MVMRSIVVSLAVFALAVCADDAESLKNEANEILKSQSKNNNATPEEYATAIFKLEKASALLESAGANNSALAQEVSASLFWARRFSNVNILAALDKLHQGGGVKLPSHPAPKPVTPAKPANSASPEPPEMARLRAAGEAYKAAESFATAHGGDEFAVSVRWFQMASQFPGTDYALKAVQNARKAQEHFASLNQEQKELPDTPEMALVKSADGMVAQSNFEGAIKLYKESLKMKETGIAHRRLASAYFKRAQQMNEDLTPKFETHYTKYASAYQGAWRTTTYGRRFDTEDPGLQRWNYDLAQLRKQSDVAMNYYMDAEQSFKSILKLAAGQKDFEAAAYIGLCQGMRPVMRYTGMRTIMDFLKAYEPANDGERVLYAFCQTELERLRK